MVYSLHRAVALDKSPAFILGQFGLTKDNVKDKVKQTGPLEMTFEVDKAYAPTLVLYCLGNSVASIVDKKLLVQNEKDGDFGYNWLKTKYAGSGPYIMRDWKANEVLVLERNPNYEKKTPLARVIYPPHQGDREPAPSAREGRHRRGPQPESGRDRRGVQERGHQDPERLRRARSIISA